MPDWEVFPHRGPGRPGPASILLTSEENSSEQALSPQEPLPARGPDLGRRKLLRFTIPRASQKKTPLNAVKRTLISSFYFFRRNTAFLILKIAQVDGRIF